MSIKKINRKDQTKYTFSLWKYTINPIGIDAIRETNWAIIHKTLLFLKKQAPNIGENIVRIE